MIREFLTVLFIVLYACGLATLLSFMGVNGSTMIIGFGAAYLFIIINGIKRVC